MVWSYPAVINIPWSVQAREECGELFDKHGPFTCAENDAHNDRIMCNKANCRDMLLFLQIGEATTYWKAEKEVRLNTSEELESAIGGLVAVGTRSRVEPRRWRCGEHCRAVKVTVSEKGKHLDDKMFIFYSCKLYRLIGEG